MLVPYPEDEYLLWLARVNYSVTYFEWLVLGDLASVSDLPVEFSLNKLVGLATGQLANALRSRSARAAVSDPRVQDWVKSGADHLDAISKARNAILHARPATSPTGQERLNRWDPKRGEYFIIETKRMIDLVEDIDARLLDLYSRRLV